MSTSETNNFNDTDDYQSRRSLSESRHSINDAPDDYISPTTVDDDGYDELPPQQLKSFLKPKQQNQIPKLINSKNLSTSMIITDNKSSSSLKWNSSSKTC